jgi:hypothetical protein
MSQPRKSLLATGFIVVLLFSIFLAGLWKTGLLSFSGTDPSAKIVVAALTLIGSFFAAVVALIGALLKYSIDQQAEGRMQLENQRNERLQKESEHRLKLEAAISAVQLLATNAGNPSPSIQRAGALFTLASLGQHGLTMALTSELLSNGQLEPSTAARLFNQALLGESEHGQHEAISILIDHAEKMLTPTGVEFPQCLLYGVRELPEYVRGWTPIVLGTLMTARPVSDWRGHIYKVAAILAALAIVWIEEPEGHIKTDAGAILKWVLQAFPDIGTLHHPRMEIDTTGIRLEVATLSPTSQAGIQVTNRLIDWYKGSREDEAPSTADRADG